MSETITIEQRKGLGKKGKLWNIEVLFNRKNVAEVCRVSLRNRTDAELMQFRKEIFSHGIMYALDPGHWLIVSPWDLVELNVWRQVNYFD
jgi:hypothetical protein